MNPDIIVREIGPNKDKTYRIIECLDLRSFELSLGRIYEFYLVVDEKLALPPIVSDTRSDDVQHMLPQLMTHIRTSLRHKFMSILSEDGTTKFVISNRSFPIIIERDVKEKTEKNSKEIILSSMATLYRDVQFTESSFSFSFFPLVKNRFNTNQAVHIKRYIVRNKIKHELTTITIDDKERRITDPAKEKIDDIIVEEITTMLGKLLF